MEDGEEVARRLLLRVHVDLRALTARKDILDVERMPAEPRGQKLRFLVGRRLELNPGQPFGLESASRGRCATSTARGCGPARRVRMRGRLGTCTEGVECRQHGHRCMYPGEPPTVLRTPVEVEESCYFTSWSSRRRDRPARARRAAPERAERAKRVTECSQSVITRTASRAYPQIGSSFRVGMTEAVVRRTMNSCSFGVRCIRRLGASSQLPEVFVACPGIGAASEADEIVGTARS